jgi:hypothetical protein
VQHTSLLKYVTVHAFWNPISLLNSLYQVFIVSSGLLDLKSHSISLCGLLEEETHDSENFVPCKTYGFSCLSFLLFNTESKTWSGTSYPYDTIWWSRAIPRDWMWSTTIRQNWSKLTSPDATGSGYWKSEENNSYLTETEKVGKTLVTRLEIEQITSLILSSLYFRHADFAP